LQDLWIKDIAITTGLVSATTTPMLLRLVAQGKLTPEKLLIGRGLSGLEGVMQRHSAAVVALSNAPRSRFCWGAG
jgi:hypothetical protein